MTDDEFKAHLQEQLESAREPLLVVGWRPSIAGVHLVTAICTRPPKQAPHEQPPRITVRPIKLAVSYASVDLAAAAERIGHRTGLPL